MREKYESMSLAALKELAKSHGMKGISAMKKSNLIDLLLSVNGDDGDTPHTQSDNKAARPVKAGTAEPAPSGGRETGKRKDETVRENGDMHSESDAVSGKGSVQPGIEAVQESGNARAGAEASAGTGRLPNEPGRVQSAQPVSGKEGQQGAYQQVSSRTGEGTAQRPRNIIRTPDRREGGQNRVRREGTYTSYRRDNNTSARRDSSGVAERRENYTASERRENYTSPERRENYTVSEQRENQAERRETASPERRTVYQEQEKRETVQSERQESAAAAERTDAVTDKPPVDLAQLDSGISVGGILEVMPDGYGFIRSDNYLPGENDVYVSPSQIRKFNLKTGDIITGNTRIKSQQEKFSALLYLRTINDMIPSEAMKRYNFEDMTPIFPNERMRMERGSRAIAMRIVDLFSPIGKGQRGMIVSPPKAGKTTLLKDVAKSILQNDPKMRLLILLIDERPEEVTDIKEAICGENVEVIYSTFDELPEHHKRVSEMVIERAKRLVEHNENVTILLDSITRLARAYNLTVPPSGRTLSGGLDPAALHMPKRFFGAARKMREGGSLTILATALVDTGSKMDDVIYEEFKGTGNMELVLDRKLSEKRVFPAIDIPKSGTRRDDLLLDREEQEAMEIMRRALNGMKSDEAVENILNMFVHTRDNRELVQKVKRQRFV